jgi:hypothetical protein
VSPADIDPASRNFQAVYRALVAASCCRDPSHNHSEAVTYCLDAPELIPTAEVRPWGPIFNDRGAP